MVLWPTAAGCPISCPSTNRFFSLFGLDPGFLPSSPTLADRACLLLATGRTRRHTSQRSMSRSAMLCAGPSAAFQDAIMHPFPAHMVAASLAQETGGRLGLGIVTQPAIQQFCVLCPVSKGPATGKSRHVLLRVDPASDSLECDTAVSYLRGRNMIIHLCLCPSRSNFLTRRAFHQEWLLRSIGNARQGRATLQ